MEQSICQLLNGVTELKIPLTKGCVYYIRFIQSRLKLYLSNRAFTLKPEVKYSYVIAEIILITIAWSYVKMVK